MKQCLYKELALKSANKIRKKKGLPLLLQLSFFEEDEHPRGKGGVFTKKGASKGSSTSSNVNSNKEQPSFRGESYDREAVRNKIKEQDSKERKHRLFKNLLHTALAGGIAGLAVTGHAPLAIGLAGGWTAYETVKLANKARKAAGRAVLHYGVRKLTSAPKIPFVGKNIPELIRGEGHTSWID